MVLASSLGIFPFTSLLSPWTPGVGGCLLLFKQSRAVTLTSSDSHVLRVRWREGEDTGFKKHKFICCILQILILAKCSTLAFLYGKRMCMCVHMCV